MNEKQREALQALSARYHVPFNESAFMPDPFLPDDYVAGWIGDGIIYVGCSPEGQISS